MGEQVPKLLEAECQEREFPLDGNGGGGTHIVRTVIFIVGQLDHTIGALDKERCP